MNDGRTEFDDYVECDDASSEAQHTSDDELRLCRVELRSAREEIERLKEAQAQGRRAGRRALKESPVLAKALARVLYRELQASVAGSKRGRRGATSRISMAEWHQVLLLHESDLFEPDWYLRNHLTVARQGIEPALHFLRYGVIEGLDPGPHFDLAAYLDANPQLRSSGENPVIHAISRETKP